jgi:hypothetical protein
MVGKARVVRTSVTATGDAHFDGVESTTLERDWDGIVEVGCCSKP